MLVKFLKPFGVLAAAAALSVSAWGQAAQSTGTQTQKQWKDNAEYELFVNITKTQDPNKRLELLNQWKEKYAQTDYNQERLLFYLDTYRLLNNGPKMLDAAREVVAANPSDITGLYWLNTLIPVQQGAGTNATLIAEAEKAGNGLLTAVGTAFAPDKKPATTSDADWAKGRTDMEALAHKTLGWVNMVRKQSEPAEKHFRESLQRNAAAGEVAYWLGSVLYAQKKVPEALFYFARASSYEGAGALAPAGRKEIEAYLQKAYTGYHGDASGLNELKTLARTNAAPPAGFTIKSVKEVHEEQIAREQAEAAQDPQGALWKRIKGELTGENGQAYFESSMKDAKPPARSFRGKVVSSTGKELQLAMSDDTTPEATLVFDAPIGKVEAGTTLQFTGVATSFNKEPFMVTFSAEKADVVGLPAAAPAKSKGRPAARKPARRK